MRRRTFCRTLLPISCSLAAASAQDITRERERYTQTMKQVVRGTRHAVSSMHQLASMAADHILQRGGNAFDAIVAGQAALGVVEPGANGIGGDAQLLVYDAKAGKVWAVNAEGTAPKLATIDWYKQNQGGKIPVNHGLLAGTVPGVVDAWYTLLSRWGTLTFAEVLAPAIELAQKGFPTQGRLVNEIQMEMVIDDPQLAKLYAPKGRPVREGEIFRNPDLARTMQRLVEAEKAVSSKGREAGLRAARDRFYKGDIAQEMARFFKEQGGLLTLKDFAAYEPQWTEPLHTAYREHEVYSNPPTSRGGLEVLP